MKLNLFPKEFKENLEKLIKESAASILNEIYPSEELKKEAEELRKKEKKKKG
jgi:hypothetical protein